MKGIIDLIINIRAVASIVVLTVFSMTIYHFLPNKTKFIRQFPGAFLTAIGWAAASYIFSAYVNIFTGFSTMYGSMTTIMLIMLWLYACMYIMLLGGEVNEDAGRRFFHIYVGRWQIQWKKADTFVKLFWRRMIWEGYIYVLYL